MCARASCARYSVVDAAGQGAEHAGHVREQNPAALVEACSPQQFLEVRNLTGSTNSAGQQCLTRSALGVRMPLRTASLGTQPSMYRWCRRCPCTFSSQATRIYTCPGHAEVRAEKLVLPSGGPVGVSLQIVVELPLLATAENFRLQESLRAMLLPVVTSATGRGWGGGPGLVVISCCARQTRLTCIPCLAGFRGTGDLSNYKRLTWNRGLQCQSYGPGFLINRQYGHVQGPAAHARTSQHARDPEPTNTGNCLGSARSLLLSLSSSTRSPFNPRG